MGKFKKTIVPDHILEKLEAILNDKLILSILSEELRNKLMKTSIAKLKYMSELAPQYLDEYNKELKDKATKFKEIDKAKKEAKKVKKAEEKVKCFRCGGKNTRKCGTFYYGTNSIKEGFHPFLYKQRYECKDCEQCERYFYYLHDREDSTKGFYIFPLTGELYDYDYMAGLHNEIKQIENTWEIFKVSQDIPEKFAAFIVKQKVKRIISRRKNLPKQIERLQLEITKYESVLEEKMKLLESADRKLAELQPVPNDSMKGNIAD